MHHVHADENELANAAADRIAAILSAALAERDRVAFVLTGGGTPEKTYRELADRHRDALDWDRVDFFWGDDRFVPHDDEESNYRMAAESLLSELSASDCGIYPVPTHLSSPEDAARAYEGTLRAYFGGREPEFDLVLFGLGPDAHVASLFPGADSLDEDERWVLHTRSPEDQPPHDRVTMTFPLLNRARTALFLVAGGKKSDAVAAAHNERDDLPVHRVQPQGQLLWYLDEAAAEPLAV